MNRIANTRGTVILILGDLIGYLFSLVFALAIRYGEMPNRALILTHLPSFLILFLVFILVNFSAGLYDKQLSFIRNRIHGVIFRAQLINFIFGIIFFYFAPVVIAPKANLFIYFAVSTAIIFLWRLVMYPVVSATKKQSAVLVGKGDDIDDLKAEVNGNTRYSVAFVEHIEPVGPIEEVIKKVKEKIDESGATILVVDLYNPSLDSALPFLYSQIFSGIQVIDASRLYESIFDRIPLSMVGERWFIENSGTALGNRIVYDILKRVMDVIISLVGGLFSLIFYPIIYASIKLEDKGPLFITQERVGKNNKLISIIKFRSMSGNDKGRYGKNGRTEHVVTKVGNVIRRTRLDELPQFFNVLKGDMSLIGPRPEFPSLSLIYEKEIPYYNARHLVKPGLSGWAQIYHEAHPHHAVATEETRNKLSYDLFYIKHRSLLLDIKIALRTLQILLRILGR